MNARQRLLDVFVFQNLFISLCSVGLIKVSAVILSQPLNPVILDLFVFFSTLLVYNMHCSFHLLKKQSVTEVMRLFISEQLSLSLKLLLYIALAGSVITFFLLENSQKVCMLVIGLITTAYSFPLLKINKSQKRLREIFFIKVFIISSVWAFATVVFPFFNSDSDAAALWMLFLERFLFVFAITIPFEIRDMQQEIKWGNRTLPVVLGIGKAKILAYGILLLFDILVVRHLIVREMSPALGMALIASTLPALMVVYLTHERRNNFFFKFFVDGTMFMQFILVILVTC